MSKPYQHHDPDFADIGKATPVPKRPTTSNPPQGSAYRWGYKITEKSFVHGIFVCCHSGCSTLKKKLARAFPSSDSPIGSSANQPG